MIEYYQLNLRPAASHETSCKDCKHFSPEPPEDTGVIGKCMLVGRAVWRNRVCDHVEPIGKAE